MSTCDAGTTYVGPALIEFSATDGGLVAVATFFWQVDGGEVQAGSTALVEDPGTHTLSFWAVDQAGNTESPANTATFTVIADTTAPTTTSNATSTYYQGATITLSATDDNTAGVITTYYTVDGGAVQEGRTIALPASTGTYTYDLLFWSEDPSGNVETANSATVTVVSGYATLRLVWGAADLGIPPSEPTDYAYWTVRRGGWSGTVVATGSGSNPGWDGVDDVTVPVSATTYFVDIWWYDSWGGYEDNTVFPAVSATTPGQVIRLSY